MYVITKIEDLMGKEIAFFSPLYHSENLIIGTADGGVFMMETEYFEDDEVEFNNMTEKHILGSLSHNKRSREALVKAGVIPERTANEWEEERKRREEKDKLAREERRKEFELKQLKSYLDKYGVPAEYK